MTKRLVDALDQTVVYPQKWTTEDQTNRLRWLKRGGQLVLQQYVAITTHDQWPHDTCIASVRGEWRDVPIEDDSR